MEPRQPAIPPNHLATTSSLLRWPSIQKLLELSGVEQIRDVQEFAIGLEQKRCPLHVCGKGEGPGGMFDEEWGQVDDTDISGKLDRSPGKVWVYVESFKNNLLNAQPIVAPKALDGMVQNFIGQFTETPREAMTGAKRKRSTAGTERRWQNGKPGIPRDISSALVLLVLALGEICLHRGKIPDVVQPDDQTRKRNVDVIPGLAYFALATDIMGAHIAGLTLDHVRVQILAGLYHAQLGRVMESSTHIYWASQTLQVILRPQLERLSKLEPGRFGWNIVTSWKKSASKAVGLPIVDHDKRYDDADGYLRLLLWEGSWADDALKENSESGVYVDNTKVRKIVHKGVHQTDAHFIVDPSPQRTPVLFQAGTSPAGIKFGSTNAEGIFVAGLSPHVVAPPVKALRESAAADGRDPQSIKIFAEIFPFIGHTEEETQAKYDRAREYSLVDGGMAMASASYSFDLSRFNQTTSYNPRTSPTSTSYRRRAIGPRVEEEEWSTSHRGDIRTIDVQGAPV